MDINAMKLKRIIAHFADDGEATPKALAEILKSKPENTAFLRGYVEAAVKENKQPELLIDFDKAAAEPEAPKAAPTKAPPVTGEIESVPEKDVPAAPAVLGDVSNLTFRYRGIDGISTQLRVVTVKGNTVILEAAPADELVTVTLKGQPATLNLTELRAKSAGDEVTVNGLPYSVAILLVIADAARL